MPVFFVAKMREAFAVELHFCSAKALLIFSTKISSVFGNKIVKLFTSGPFNKLVKLTKL